jgi:hypothetical protein
MLYWITFSQALFPVSRILMNNLINTHSNLFGEFYYESHLTHEVPLEVTQFTLCE